LTCGFGARGRSCPIRWWPVVSDSSRVLWPNTGRGPERRSGCRDCAISPAAGWPEAAPRHRIDPVGRGRGRPGAGRRGRSPPASQPRPTPAGQTLVRRRRGATTSPPARATTDCAPETAAPWRLGGRPERRTRGHVPARAARGCFRSRRPPNARPGPHRRSIDGWGAVTAAHAVQDQELPQVRGLVHQARS